jgi:hypothetical protein
MHVLEVQLNGKTLVIAGATNAVLLSGRLSIFVQGPQAATLSVTGMNDLGDERQSHTRWLEEYELRTGDTVGFKFGEGTPTPPLAEVATDSEEHRNEQEWYDEELRQNPVTPQVLSRLLPNATLRLLFPDEAPIVATLEGGREFISFGLTWNQWHPERCRVALSSFSQEEALARAGSKEWFQGRLKLGDKCVVEVAS